MAKQRFLSPLMLSAAAGVASVMLPATATAAGVSPTASDFVNSTPTLIELPEAGKVSLLVVGAAQSSSTNAYGQTTGTGTNAYGQTTSTGSNAYGQTTSTGTNAYGETTSTGTNAYGQTTGTGTNAYGQTTGTGTNAYGQTTGTGTNAYGQTTGTGNNAYGQTTTLASAVTLCPKNLPTSVSFVVTGARPGEAVLLATGTAVGGYEALNANLKLGGSIAIVANLQITPSVGNTVNTVSTIIPVSLNSLFSSPNVQKGASVYLQAVLLPGGNLNNLAQARTTELDKITVDFDATDANGNGTCF